MDFKIREDRRPQGPGKLVQEREAYFRLMDQGMGYSEAAAVIGINVRTGKRWRNGRGASGRNKAAPPINAVVPPSVETGQPAPSRYLGEADRIHIADRLREKATVRAIAAELGRSPSTINREISPKAASCPSTPARTSTPSPPNSTAAHAIVGPDRRSIPRDRLPPCDEGAEPNFLKTELGSLTTHPTSGFDWRPSAF